MNILYDYQAFEMQKFGGISRYFANLYKNIPIQYGFDVKISALVSNNHYFNKLIPNQRLSFLNHFPKRRENLNKNYSRYCISKNNFDVFHPTYYHPYFLKKLKKPFVLTVHDFIHEKYPAFFQGGDATIERKRILIEKAAKIIAISNATKNDLLQLYPLINPNKIEVVYHGHFSIKNEDTYNISLPDSYVLYVGDRTGYKNFFTLLDSFASIMYSDVSLLCTGRGFNTMEESYIKFKGLEGRVQQIAATDKQLYHIYKNAIFFIYPSLYEGFGLPILEAFESECPVLLSDIGCFKEVAADNALYFNPQNVSDIADKMNYALRNRSQMQQFARGGYERLRYFSSEENVKKTVDVYNLI